MEVQSVPCKMITTGILNCLPIIVGKYDQWQAKETTILEILFLKVYSLKSNEIWLAITENLLIQSLENKIISYSFFKISMSTLVKLGIPF